MDPITNGDAKLALLVATLPETEHENLDFAMVVRPDAIEFVQKQADSASDIHERTSGVRPASMPEELIPKLKITNVIAKLRFSDRIDLAALAKKQTLWNICYNTCENEGMKLYLKKTEAVATLSAIGLMVVTGARSVKEVRSVAKRFLKKLDRVGLDTTDVYQTLDVTNIMAVCDISCTFNLKDMVNCPFLREKFNVIYDNSYEMSVNFSFSNPEVSMSCYTSGKLNFSGARKVEDIREAFRQFCAATYSFRM